MKITLQNVSLSIVYGISCFAKDRMYQLDCMNEVYQQDKKLNTGISHYQVFVCNFFL